MSHLKTEQPVHPVSFIIFGATGDLATKKIFASLFTLYLGGLLPEAFSIVAFARRPFSHEEYRNMLKESSFQGFAQNGTLESFLSRITYQQGMFEDEAAYHSLAQHLLKIDEAFGLCANKIFHLAVPPSFYEKILNSMSISGLTISCAEGGGKTRLLIEKPIGYDLSSAKKILEITEKIFKKDQVFFIDHYLAKETLQNILAFRFSNTLFDPLWNKNHIEKVEIHLFESISIEGRGEFYDNLGAFRDVGQNHLLQMLALVAMERPEMFKGEDVRRKREDILKKVKSSKLEDIVRAQYEEFGNEKGVKADSQTETYFSVKTYVNVRRWRGVPFYLRSGKSLSESKAEIKIYFKDPDPKSYLPNQYKMQEHNVLSFDLSPEEGISIMFWAKVPGFDYMIEPKKLSFKYRETPESKKLPDAYEKVFYDAIMGDQTLFTSSEEVLAEWQFTKKAVNLFEKSPLLSYKKGASYKDIK